MPATAKQIPPQINNERRCISSLFLFRDQSSELAATAVEISIHPVLLPNLARDDGWRKTNCMEQDVHHKK
jgi:hypothetical protein